MKRLPNDVGRYALWRASDGGRYWTGDCDTSKRRPVMTTLLENARLFPSPRAAYDAAARIRDLQSARPVRVP